MSAKSSVASMLARALLLAVACLWPFPAAALPPAQGSTPGPAVPAAGRDVPILEYHYLTDGTIPPTQYYVTRAMFAGQMAALKAYGYQTVSLQDFVNYRNGRGTLPNHPVILTFDDGHESVYSDAAPILNSLGMTATLFITTDFIDPSLAGHSSEWMVWDPQIQTLYGEGYAIESHSLTHPHLTQLPQDLAQSEILSSRLTIQSRLGNQVRFFAYPHGDGANDPRIRGYVQKAGYLGAVAAFPDGIANTATSDIWALPRVFVDQINSINLDPAHPEHFFMRKVDPTFPLPSISIDAIQVLHAGAIPGACFAPGDIVTVKVTATNRGASVTTRLSVALDDDIGHSTTYYAKTADLALPAGSTRTASFVTGLASELAAGPHYLAMRLQDEHQVLDFAHRDWQPAFLFNTACYTHFLATVRR